ncbi:MAG: 3-phosphoshikimate 1-carboxyvinyltransferase [Muribaculaceae bacterium]|nr:3-phosphoshikimate 1-carboxyvinyltransferase [Muribaculaceae bacterium]
MTLNVVSELISGRKAEFPALPDAEDVAGMSRAIGHADSHRVNIGEGGAPFRFFTALAASIPGLDLTLTTRRPLIRRPHAILFNTLREAGADIRSIRRPDRPPLHIIGRLLDPPPLRIDPGVSSQFISALMMAAPLWKSGLDLTFEGANPVSLPYLRMTGEVMKRFGCEVMMDDDRIRVAPGKCIAPAEYKIPTDWSAASYFYELALLLPGKRIPLQHLTPPAESLQGDAECAGIFRHLGVMTLYDSIDDHYYLYLPTSASESLKNREATYVIDLNGTPDLAPALAVGFCLAGIRFRFENVAHLRHKETDRMAALETELRKLGYVIRTGTDSMDWDGATCRPEEHPVISTYSDHRMAMAFAPAAVRYPGLTIEHPEVTVKSFPCYWEMLERIGFQLSEVKITE